VKGRIKIVGRNKDIIIQGGENMSFWIVELLHPDIEEIILVNLNSQLGK